jgi:hypothetical protein
MTGKGVLTICAGLLVLLSWGSAEGRGLKEEPVGDVKIYKPAKDGKPERLLGTMSAEEVARFRAANQPRSGGIGGGGGAVAVGGALINAAAAPRPAIENATGGGTADSCDKKKGDANADCAAAAKDAGIAVLGAGASTFGCFVGKNPISCIAMTATLPNAGVKSAEAVVDCVNAWRTPRMGICPPAER